MAVEHVDHRLAAPDRYVDARQPLVAAEHELVVELDTEITEPVDGGTGELGEASNHGRVDVPAVQRQVVVVQRLGRVLDSLRLLVARPGTHDQTA
jgi:hypothetical protein